MMTFLVSVGILSGITEAENNPSLRNGRHRSRVLEPDTIFHEIEPVVEEPHQNEVINTQPITGGEKVLSHREYPYFGFVSTDGFNCGGALIAPDIILTAAHCKPTSTGKIFFNTTSTIRWIERTFDRCTQHPKYSIAAFLDYDYALCKLDQPVTTIQPIKLDNGQNNLSSNQELLIMGHGKTENAYPSQDLLDATIKYIDNTECSARIPDYVYSRESFPTDSMMCATIPDEGAQGPCHGDSGGPVVLRKMDFDGTHVDIHVGLVSWGIGQCGHPGFLSLYARTSHAFEWIMGTMCHELGSNFESCDTWSASPSSAPSESPSSAPSESPTSAPSESPSSSCLPSAPAGHGMFHFVGIKGHNILGEEKTKSCRWLGNRKNSARKKKICCLPMGKLNVKGTAFCPETNANGATLLVKEQCSAECSAFNCDD